MRAVSIFFGTIVALCLVATGIHAQGVDTDGDGVPDAIDSCLLVPNGPADACNQVDSDLDGYGNSCDADYTNDGLVGGTDFSYIVNQFGTSHPNDPIAPADFNCDGLVSGTDYAHFVTYANGRPVGPSGLACAGTIPCVP